MFRKVDGDGGVDDGGVQANGEIDVVGEPVDTLTEPVDTLSEPVPPEPLAEPADLPLELVAQETLVELETVETTEAIEIETVEPAEPVEPSPVELEPVESEPMPVHGEPTEENRADVQLDAQLIESSVQQESHALTKSETWPLTTPESIVTSSDLAEPATITTEREIVAMNEKEESVNEESAIVAPVVNVSATDASKYEPGDGHLEAPKLDTNHDTQVAIVTAQLPFGHVQVTVKEQVACAWILKNVLGPLMGDVEKNQP